MKQVKKKQTDTTTIEKVEEDEEISDEISIAENMLKVVEKAFQRCDLTFDKKKILEQTEKDGYKHYAKYLIPRTTVATDQPPTESFSTLKI